MESFSAHEARLSMVAGKFGGVAFAEVRSIGLSGVVRASVAIVGGPLSTLRFSAEARDPRHAVRNCLKAIESAAARVGTSTSSTQH